MRSSAAPSHLRLIATGLGLTLSLVLNAALLHRPPSPGTLSAPPAAATPAIAPADPLVDAWARLDAADPAALLTNLRAANLPESLVRQIVWTKLQPLSPYRITAPDEASYWRREAAMFEQRVRHQAGTSDPAYDAYVALLDTAPMELGNPGQTSVNAAMRGLSLDAYLAVQQIERDYFLRPYDGPTPTTPESWARYTTENVRQLLTDLQSSLTPEQFRNYATRGSTAMRQISEDLAGLRLSQTEYDSIALLVATHPHLNLRGDGREQLQPQIEPILGPGRVPEFTQAVKGTAATNRLVARLGLPLTAAATIDATRNEINQRARQLKADASLDPTARDAQLAALAAEARQRVTTAVVSAENYDAYYEYQGGWILEITGTPPPVP